MNPDIHTGGGKGIEQVSPARHRDSVPGKTGGLDHVLTRMIEAAVRRASHVKILRELLDGPVDDHPCSTVHEP